MNSLYSLVLGKVEYGPVRHCQKCVWCVNDATQEAILKQGNITVISRCCDDPICTRLSAESCEHTVAT
jgi:hypothetical protein